MFNNGMQKAMQKERHFPSENRKAVLSALVVQKRSERLYCVSIGSPGMCTSEIDQNSRAASIAAKKHQSLKSVTRLSRF